MTWHLSAILGALLYSQEPEWLHMEVLQGLDALGEPSVRNTAHPTPNSNVVTRREVGGHGYPDDSSVLNAWKLYTKLYAIRGLHLSPSRGVHTKIGVA